MLSSSRELKMWRFTIGSLLFFAAQVAAAQTVDPFPLQAGAHWIYHGTVNWQEENNPRKAVIDWKIEVLRTARVGRFDVAVMKGDFQDLTFYEPGKPRSNYLIVKDEGKYYRLDPSGLNVNRLLSNPGELQSNLAFDILFLDFPLADGKRFGQDPSAPRNDSMYCWNVEKALPVLVNAKQYPAFALSYRTNPDRTLLIFAPGIGFTHFEYEHHGTVSEASLSLTEYHPGK